MAAQYVVITFKSYWYQKRFLPPDASHKKDFTKNIQPRFQYLSLCIQKLPMITLTCSKSQNHTNSHLVKSSIYKKDKIARSFCISQICSFACGGENRPHSPKIDNYKVICALLFLHKDWKYPLCILLMAQLFWVGATCVKTQSVSNACRAGPIKKFTVHTCTIYCNFALKNSRILAKIRSECEGILGNHLVSGRQSTA